MTQTQSLTLTLNQLKEQSFRIQQGTKVFVPQISSYEVLDISKEVEKDRVYYYNNGIISFVIGREFYVTPATKRILDSLRNEGFKLGVLYVPFSNGDYPVTGINRIKDTKWSNLVSSCYKERQEEKIKDWNRWNDSIGITPINPEFLKKTLAIPTDGLSVEKDGKYSYVMPLDVTFIGSFSTNNGVVVFIDYDGITRIARSEELMHTLRSSGYVYEKRFVPLSNGEKITIPWLNSFWNKD